MKIRKVRKTFSKVGGRPITEGSVLQDIKNHYDAQNQNKSTKRPSKDSQEAGYSGDHNTKKKRKSNRKGKENKKKFKSGCSQFR